MSVYRVITPDGSPAAGMRRKRKGAETTRADSATGFVHSVETFGTLDGPGIRYVVFMQGCHLQCMFCQNRDTWPRGWGKEVAPADIVDDVLRMRAYIERSGGGVTASGGDPIIQPKFVTALFEQLRHESIHTALDTSGVSPLTEDVERLLAATDLVLLDIKHIDADAHRELTGRSNELVLDFAKHLADIEKPVWIRHVVIPGYTLSRDVAWRTAQFLATLGNVEVVELLRYHELGKHKWAAMGEDYPLEGTRTPTITETEEIADEFRAAGLRCRIG